MELELEMKWVLGLLAGSVSQLRENSGRKTVHV